MLFARPTGWYEVAITEENADNLVGDWKGEVESASEGKVGWKSSVTLELFNRAGSLKGEFAMKQGNRVWKTDPKLERGKLIMVFGRQPRVFSLAKKGNTYYLEASYESVFAGKTRQNTLRLKKE